MAFTRRLHVRIAWLALAAMLAAAVSPGISHAMRAAVAPEAWGEICRAMPGAALRDGGAETPGAPGVGGGPQDCPFCLPGAGHPAPPPAPLYSGAAAPPAFELPRLFLLAPSASCPWRAAQPRAPPIAA